jgi:hypothetical protein
MLHEGHAERAPVDDQHFVALQAMLVVGIVLRRSPRRWTWSGGRRRTRIEASWPGVRPYGGIRKTSTGARFPFSVRCCRSASG